MRAEAIERFAEFVGLRDRVEDTGVQSYAHRTLLAYIGVAHLARPPDRRRRLAGLERAMGLGAIPGRRAAPLPGRAGGGVPVGGAPLGRADPLRPGARRPGRDRLRRARDPLRRRRGRRRPRCPRLSDTARRPRVAARRRRRLGRDRDRAGHAARLRSPGSRSGWRPSVPDARLDPPWSMPTYAVRAPLVRWLARGGAAAHTRRLGPYRLLDVGCGEKPYAPLFAPYVREHVGVDAVENPHAELRGADRGAPGRGRVVRRRPLRTGARALRRPGRGRARAVPGDTAGRARARLDARRDGLPPGPRRSLALDAHGARATLRRGRRAGPRLRYCPAAGTTASLAMLVSIYLDHVLRRFPLRPLRRPVVAGLNRSAHALDGRAAVLREPRPGTLCANYHVLAVK